MLEPIANLKTVAVRSTHTPLKLTARLKDRDSFVLVIEDNEPLTILSAGTSLPLGESKRTILDLKHDKRLPKLLEVEDLDLTDKEAVTRLARLVGANRAEGVRMMTAERGEVGYLHGPAVVRWAERSGIVALGAGLPGKFEQDLPPAYTCPDHPWLVRVPKPGRGVPDCPRCRKKMRPVSAAISIP